MTIRTSRAIAGTALLGIAVLGFLYFSKYAAAPAISSFEECKAAGYQIMESYPERCSTPDGSVFVNANATSTPSTGSTDTPTTPATGMENKIRVSVAPNQLVASPLTVTGSAIGGWYFEASFPVELVDGNGKRLAAGPAQAQSDWMTPSFVPFVITLTFAEPGTATGTLILRNDNPSGLPENQEELRIPVRFSTTEKMVKLYYYSENLDKDTNGNILCSSKGLVPVDRNIPATETPLRDTIALLLRGQLTPSEKAAGISTEFPLDGVSLTNATLSSGVATLAIADPQNKTSGGACRAEVLRAQIEATAKQFSTVRSVTFSPSTLFQP